MRIVRSVHQCWEDGKLPLLLSRLGIQDGAELSTATKKLGMTLKQYLTTRLSDEVQVIQHSPRTQLVGALPISVDVDSEGGAEALLERTQRTEVDEMPRFCPALNTSQDYTNVSPVNLRSSYPATVKRSFATLV